MADEIAIVDQLNRYVENIQPTSSGALDRKTRTLYVLQEKLGVVWTAAEWWFRWKRFTATIAINTSSTNITEVDFSDIPTVGGRCWNTVTGRRLELMPESYIQAHQENPADSVSEPDEFSIYGQDDGPPYGPLIQTRKVTQQANLALWGHRTIPTLSLNTTDVQLHLFPDEWVQPVLVPACRAVLQKAKGDVKEWTSEFESGLRRMLDTAPQVKAGRWPPKGFFGD